MRMGTPRNEVGRGMRVTADIPVSDKPSVAVDLSFLKSMKNEARDRAWMLGDQAMKKAIGEGSYTIYGGCFQ
jgi:hypothetical protein